MEVTRDEGRRRALDELSDPVYGSQEPTLIERLRAWFMELLESLADLGGGVLSGQWYLVALLVLVAVLVVWLIVYLRPSRSRARGVPVHEGRPLSAADHRSAADAHEAAGAYAEAVAERLRAISVDLEDRAVVTPRAGRTATELAAEAAVVLPDEATALRDGAAVFNDVAYGDREATADSTRVMRELDERLRAARPAPAEEAHP
ncbi:membrane protein [Nocardiopsis sp. NRRL B-16309]|nr:membrane protein [Nocardiopsis sp. NRRL B-16309]